MECKELFIFENGQPLTTPPPQVSFWAFRLTVSSTCTCTWKCSISPSLSLALVLGLSQASALAAQRRETRLLVEKKHRLV